MSDIIVPVRATLPKAKVHSLYTNPAFAAAPRRAFNPQWFFVTSNPQGVTIVRLVTNQWVTVGADGPVPAELFHSPAFHDVLKLRGEELTSALDRWRINAPTVHPSDRLELELVNDNAHEVEFEAVVLGRVL